MAVLLQNSFESDTIGQISPGWTNINGTWSVTTSDPVTGTRAFQAPTAGNFVVISNISAKSYQKVTMAQKIVDAATIDNYYGLAVRVAANGSSGYLFFPKAQGSNYTALNAYKFSALNSYTLVSSTGGELPNGMPPGTIVIGAILMMEVIANGGTIECRWWLSTGTRPTNANSTITDSAFSTGTIGVYRSVNSATPMSFDDITYEDDSIAVPATVITMSGPTTGTVGAASAPFTIGANGTITGTVVVMPNDGGAGGTFSPTSVSINTASPTGTFTYNASSAGTKTVSVTNNGSLTNPSSISYAAVAYVPGAGQFMPTNTNLYFSPYNWYSNGTGAMQSNNIRAGSTVQWSNMRGSYFKMKVTGTSAITLTVDTTTLAAINAAGCPQLAWSVNGAAVQSTMLASGQTTVTIASSLSNVTTYEIFLWFRGVYITMDGDSPQNYNTPNNRFQLVYVNTDAGGSLVMPTVKPKLQLSYGDSITEGDLSNGGPRSATSQDANLVYPWYLAEALNAEVGIVGFYGQLFSWFTSSWPNYANGFSRLIGGLLSPAPDYITANYGENDGSPGPSTSAISSTLTAVTAAAPSAKCFIFVPFSGKARTNLSAATLPSNWRLVDLNRYEMAPGNTQWSYDGQHPNAKGHANLGALAAGAIYPMLSSFSAGLAGRTVTVTLGLDASTPAANLTGLKVSYFDEATPDLHTVARFKTASGTTNASGVLTFSAQSTLASGGTGYLVVQGANGVHYNAPVVVS